MTAQQRELDDLVETPPAANAPRWRLRDRMLDLRVPQIMAICNVTPDSFSDGGRHLAVEDALRFAADAFRDGAAILDVGGESTRPGATPVSESEELVRVLPVIAAVRSQLPGLIVSVDTVKSAVAREALAAGAHAVNDVSAGRLDAAMFSVVANAQAAMVLMHSRGGVGDMASCSHAFYGPDVVLDVREALLASVAAARAAGIRDDSLVIDPGIGFSKTAAQSITLLRELSRLTALGYPVMVGASRKRFVGELTDVHEPAERAVGSVVVHAIAVMRGARIIRTHDVRATRQGLAVAVAL